MLDKGEYPMITTKDERDQLLACAIQELVKTYDRPGGHSVSSFWSRPYRVGDPTRLRSNRSFRLHYRKNYKVLSEDSNE